LKNFKTESIKSILIIIYLSFLLPVFLFDIQNSLKLWFDFGKEIIDYLTKPDFSFAYQLSLKSFLYDIMIVFPCLLIYKIENYNKIWNSFKKSKVFAIIATLLLFIGTLLIALHVGLVFADKGSHFQPEWPLIWLVLMVIPLREWLLILCSYYNKVSPSQDITQLKLIDDQPIEHYKGLSETKQNIYSHIKRVLAGYNETSNYLCLALNGSWGSGKTSILKAIENSNSDCGLSDELRFSDYEILWINVWQSKSPDFAIRELESQMEEFFSKYYFNFTIDGLNFFKLLIKMYDDKVADLFGALSLAASHDSLKTARENLEKSIDDCLKAANKKKILIIFDDIDRVHQQEYINAYLNLLCYVTGLKNVVSLVGVDLENLNKKLCNGKSNENFNTLISIDHEVAQLEAGKPRENNGTENKPKQKIIYDQEVADGHYRFADKIFNSIISVGESQTSLHNFILKLSNEKFNFLQFTDHEEIKTQFFQGFDSCWEHDVFKDYREIKQIINHMQCKLDLMQSNGKLKKLQDMIVPWLVFALSVIEIKHNDLYLLIKKALEIRFNDFLFSFIEKQLYELEAKGWVDEKKIAKNSYYAEVAKTINALKNIDEKYSTFQSLQFAGQIQLWRVGYYINPVYEPYQFTNTRFSEIYEILEKTTEYDDFDAKLRITLAEYFNLTDPVEAYKKASHEFTARMSNLLGIIRMGVKDDLPFMENLFICCANIIHEVSITGLQQAKSDCKEMFKALVDIYHIFGDDTTGNGRFVQIVSNTELIKNKPAFKDILLKVDESKYWFYREKNIIYLAICECIIEMILSDDNSEEKEKLLEIAGLVNNDDYLLSTKLSEKTKFISGNYGKSLTRKIKSIFFRYFEAVAIQNLYSHHTRIIIDISNFIQDGIEQENINSLTVFLQKMNKSTSITKDEMKHCLTIVFLAVDRGINDAYDDNLQPIMNLAKLDLSKLIDIYGVIINNSERFEWKSHDDIKPFSNVDGITLSDCLNKFKQYHRYRLFYANRFLLRSGKAIFKKYLGKESKGNHTFPYFCNQK